MAELLEVIGTDFVIQLNGKTPTPQKLALLEKLQSACAIIPAVTADDLTIIEVAQCIKKQLGSANAVISAAAVPCAMAFGNLFNKQVSISASFFPELFLLLNDNNRKRVEAVKACTRSLIEGGGKIFLDDIRSALEGAFDSKVPRIRAESMLCLCNNILPAWPRQDLVGDVAAQQLIARLVRKLSDSVAGVRDASAECLAFMIEHLGQELVVPLFADVDLRALTRVADAARGNSSALTQRIAELTAAAAAETEAADAEAAAAREEFAARSASAEEIDDGLPAEYGTVTVDPTWPVTLAMLQGLQAADSRTVLAFDERMLLHEQSGHPEAPLRLRTLVRHLHDQGLVHRCAVIGCTAAGAEHVQSVHTERLAKEFEAIGPGAKILGGDMFANEFTGMAARLAVGGTCDVSLAVWNGQYRNGFALVRPPGHHAECNQMMGFCFANNVAVAAKAIQKAGAAKVAIVDWDVHHGNGTQDIFRTDPSVLYISLHRYGFFYPGTGPADSIGLGDGRGTSVNIPFTGGSETGDRDYLFAFRRLIVPMIREHGSNCILVSSGFDAAAGDPLGSFNVTPYGYAHMTKMLQQLADEICGGKLVIALEGGYNPRAVACGAAACLRVLLGEEAPAGEIEGPTAEGLRNVNAVIAAHRELWAFMRDDPSFEVAVDVASGKLSALALT